MPPVTSMSVSLPNTALFSSFSVPPCATTFAAFGHLPFGPNASVPLVTCTTPVEVLSALHMW